MIFIVVSSSNNHSYMHVGLLMVSLLGLVIYSLFVKNRVGNEVESGIVISSSNTIKQWNIETKYCINTLAIDGIVSDFNILVYSSSSNSNNDYSIYVNPLI